VPFQREPHVLRAHSAAVVDHLDQAGSAAGQPDRYIGRARIQRILDQFLKSARRPLDHLPGRDSVDKLGRQSSY